MKELGKIINFEDEKKKRRGNPLIPAARISVDPRSPDERLEGKKKSKADLYTQLAATHTEIRTASENKPVRQPTEGTVDFDTLRIVSEVNDSLPHQGDEFRRHDIIFDSTHTHLGIIASLTAEYIHQFEDSEQESLNVSGRTTAILKALGVEFTYAESDDEEDHIIFNAEQNTTDESADFIN